MLFETFERESSANLALCEKYSGQLPSELIDVWQKYGFGSLLNGYLKVIDPDEYRDLLDDTYILSGFAIPIFATAFADIVTWERGRYLRMVDYKNGTFSGMSAGFKFFWGDLADGAFNGKFFDLELYDAAAGKLGRPRFDECFGYVPLLGLGGGRGVDSLRRVKLREHIALIAQLMGKVGE